MDQTIARLNIEHYRALLAGTLDDSKRQTIVDLLAEEEAKLAQLVKAHGEKPARLSKLGRLPRDVGDTPRVEADCEPY